MPSFSTLSLRDRAEHKMPVHFTQAAFSIQAPITQREKKTWFQTINGLKLSQLHTVVMFEFRAVSDIPVDINDTGVIRYV